MQYWCPVKLTLKEIIPFIPKFLSALATIRYSTN